VKKKRRKEILKGKFFGARSFPRELLDGKILKMINEWSHKEGLL
jgi:hypothetical protein